jgi:hypothetical protein
MTVLDEGPTKSRGRRPQPDMMIAYLKYAVADMRALSPHGTQLLEDAIAALIEDTALNGGEAHDARR